MIVREATEGDIDAIARLLADDGLGRGREAPGDPVYAEAFRAMSAQPGNVYLVAEEHGRVIGCLQFTVIHGLSRQGAARAQIEGVRVDAARRGRGVGEALFEAAFERAAASGCALVQLTTDRRRSDALRFYERLGFEATHWGMKRVLLVAALILGVLPAAIGRADGFCADVRTLIAHARSGFSSTPSRSGEGGTTGPLMLRGASDCQVARQLDGSFFYCTWKHPFRSAGATGSFERINRELQECLGDRATIRADQGVNHPDFYDSRHYILDGAGVTVSLKDKVALQSTLVFVRVNSRE